MKKIYTAVIGLITGFANGLFGSGGGTIIVPALQKVLRVDTHKSHATAIAVILPLSVISMFVYLRGVRVDVQGILWLSVGGVAGGFIGAKFLNKISKAILHKVFGLCMIFAAVRMIIR